MPENHFRRDARSWRARPPDLLLGLQMQPLDRDQRRPMARPRQAFRSGSAARLQRLRQARRRRAAGLQLEQEAGQDDGLSSSLVARIFGPAPYLKAIMSKAFDFCIPTRGTKVPHTPEWLHEIKYDGYRLRVERNGDRVRLITRNGYDWSKRYPWIVESALKNRQKQFVIDGEAVILGVDGISDFNALHSGKHNEEVQLYAFDMLAGDGDDLRSLPLSMRKTNLARLLARRPDGIFAAPFEQGEIGVPVVN
jgi:bifunctional non-homologous end joining protein LigD